MELVYRFALGGILVSVFAVLGDCFKPKTFAGLFGAAPSVALAGLALAWLTRSAISVGEESYAMIWGALAMLSYSACAYWILKHTKWPPWLGTSLLWLEWLVVALGLHAAVSR